MPGVTAELLAEMDAYVELSRKMMEEYDLKDRDDRIRERTKERVRRFRQRQKLPAS